MFRRLPSALVMVLAAATFVACSDEVGFTVDIVNDTSTPVLVRQCGDDRCSKFSSSGDDIVQPAHFTSPATSTADLANPYLVMVPGGSVLGCFPLRYTHVPRSRRLLVSQVPPCEQG